MVNKEHIDVLKKGSEEWNNWRKLNSSVAPILSDIDFTAEFPNENEIYNLPSFESCDFTHADLNRSSLRNGFYSHCNFDGASINFADLVDAYFLNCSFKDVKMRVTKIGSATFSECIFQNSDLSYCSAEDTDFSGSRFIETKLEHMSFVGNNFSNTEIESCSIFGISSWDLNLDNSQQRNLIVTKEDEPVLTVDSIELAQFMYLIINNKRLRDVIDTITSKVVLLLGNFSPEQKKVLDKFKEKLRNNNYVPVMFDFDKPISRNLTETVFTLASMSKFVIANLSSPRSIPHELSAIIPRLQSVSFYPIINEKEQEYGMFEEIKNYPWVKPVKEYMGQKIDGILNEILEIEKHRV